MSRLFSSPAIDTRNLNQKKMSYNINSINAGTIFRHYKGNLYEFICLAKDHKTNEEIVVYKSVKENTNFWTRPKHEFMETIVYEGHTYQRFSLEQNNFHIIISPDLLKLFELHEVDIETLNLFLNTQYEIRNVVFPEDNAFTSSKELTIAIIVTSSLAITIIVNSINKLLKTLQHKPVIIQYDELEEIYEEGKILKDSTGKPIWKKIKKHEVISFDSDKEITDIGLNAGVKGITLTYKNRVD